MKHETDYWKKRQEQLFLQGEKSIKEYYKELKKAFTIAQNEIKIQLFEFYSQYAKENGVSFVEAQKRLSQAELKGLQEYIERVQQTMGTYDLTLSNMSIKARVTRLEALQMQIDAILQELYATSYEQKGKEVLTNIYEDNYNQLWYHSDKYLGIHQEFAHINPRDVEQVISYPFNGQNFSQRLWKQKDFLQMKLNECLTHSLIVGTEPSKLAKDFATHFERREYEAYRLLHTETSYVLEQSTLAGYKESGVEYYKILATLDQKTSDICKKQDGKVYAISEAVVGVNYPPFHIFCRTTTVPEYEDVPAEGFRMARGEDGKPMKVPADMTYLEWEKKYATVFISDEIKKEFQKYNTMLGNKLLGIEDFMKIRYNNKEWKAFKSYISAIKIGELSPLVDFKLYKDISHEMDNKLIGITTSNGIAILGKSNHAIARIIGSVEQRRNGVSVDDVLEALINNESEVLPVKELKNGKSQKFRSGVVEVSVNPDTGNIIQANPIHRKKVDS